MSIAEEFFNSFKQEKFLSREIEKQLSANSVFTSRPFQKNIQTGTYRTWKDLSLDIDKINIWPHLNYNSEYFTLIEGYPTEAWKRLNNTNRFSKDLSILKKNCPEVEKIDIIKTFSKDHQDASLLALLCLTKLRDGIIFWDATLEGDILR